MFGLSFLNQRGNIVISSEITQPLFHAKIEGNLVSRSGPGYSVDIPTGIPSTEPPPIVYSKCFPVSSQNLSVETIGCPIQRIYVVNNFWVIRIARGPDFTSLANVPYSFLVFKLKERPSLSQEGFGLDLFNQDGNRIFSTSDSNAHIINKIDFWNYNLEAPPPERMIDVIKLDDSIQPYILSPLPVSFIYIPPAERRPMLYRISNFVHNVLTNSIAVAHFGGSSTRVGSTDTLDGFPRQSYCFILDGNNFS